MSRIKEQPCRINPIISLVDWNRGLQCVEIIVGLASKHHLCKPKRHLSAHFLVCNIVLANKTSLVDHMAHVTGETFMTNLVLSQRPDCFQSICCFVANYLFGQQNSQKLIFYFIVTDTCWVWLTFESHVRVRSCRSFAARFCTALSLCSNVSLLAGYY